MIWGLHPETQSVGLTNALHTYGRSKSRGKGLDKGRRRTSQVKVGQAIMTSREFISAAVRTSEIKLIVIKVLTLWDASARV